MRDQRHLPVLSFFFLSLPVFFFFFSRDRPRRNNVLPDTAKPLPEIKSRMGTSYADPAATRQKHSCFVEYIRSLCYSSLNFAVRSLDLRPIVTYSVSTDSTKDGLTGDFNTNACCITNWIKSFDNTND